MNKVEIGRLGEKLAKEYLIKQGYRILTENYRTPLGEIDLVVEKDQTTIFVEVRTKTSQRFGTPEESITPKKQERLIRLALQFCAHHYLYSQNLRFDIIAIYLDKIQPSIKHISNAFLSRR